MTQSINQSINYEAVCRTAPATPGLLKIVLMLIQLLRLALALDLALALKLALALSIALALAYSPALNLDLLLNFTSKIAFELALGML